jgi:fructose-bisphosphate aldolase class II
MKKLREYILDAKDRGVAIGHFNISNVEALHGIYNAAKKLDVPVIIGLSEGEEGFLGIEEAVALVKTIRERDDYPIFLNADHHASFDSVKKCVDMGFDMVIIDMAKSSFEDNIKTTRECVEYVHKFNIEHSTDVLVEGEIGYIGSGSNIKDSIPDGAGVLTTVIDAKKFVDETGVDLLAPSIGSIHGLIKSGKPHINTELTREISEAVNIPLVLHGGSGLQDMDFTNAISAGVSIVHINSEIRLAFKEAVEKFIENNPNEITPAKILQPAVDAIEKVVEARLKLFNNIK